MPISQGSNWFYDAADDAFSIDYSCAFDRGSTEYMQKDCAATVTAERRTFTISVWVKRLEIGSLAAVAAHYIFEAGETDHTTTGRTVLQIRDDFIRFMSGTTYWFTTESLYRDNSAWMHIVLAVDTTDNTAGDRHKLYVNGVRVTEFDSGNTTNPDQNHTHAFSLDEKHTIGGSHIDSYYNTDLKMAEFHAVGGAALAPTAFGEFDSDSGIWKPIEYTGTSGTGSTGWGTNGWYLDFSDSGNMGDDKKTGGTVLDFTENNIDVKNQTKDSPMNSYCVLDQDAKQNYDTATQTIDRYNTRLFNGTDSWSTTLATHAFSSGKWYWEVESGNITYWASGIISVDKTHLLYENTYEEAVAYRGGVGGAYARDGNPDVSTNLGAPSSTNKVFRFFVDMDNNKFTVITMSGTTVIDEQNVGGCAENDRLSVPFIRTYGINTGNNTHGVNINFGGGTLWAADSAVGGYYNTGQSAFTDANGYGEFEYPCQNINSKNYYAICTNNIAEFS